jgi:hypothetical protein
MTLPADVARCLGALTARVQDLPTPDGPCARASRLVDWPVGTGGCAMRAKDTK